MLMRSEGSRGIRLSDDAVRDFIMKGYLTVQTGLPRSFHETVYRKTQELTAREGNLGNNVLPRVPELQAVFEDPCVRGALTSILGEDYVMHSHRHPHQNRPHSEGQGFHKDSYWGYQKVRHHCPRWAMAFYYPQDSPLEMGPSAVLPGTQYYEGRVSEGGAGELALSGEAGTVTIIHFDLWHRAMANMTDKTRYMMKFQFIRMDAPSSDRGTLGSESSDTASWPGSDADGVGTVHSGTWRHVWSWLSGDTAGADAASAGSGDVGASVSALGAAESAVRARGADALGRFGDSAGDAVPALIAALEDPSEPVRLNAAYALGAIGAAAVSGLIGALGSESGSVRRMAAYGLAAVGADAVPALGEALGHSESQVRVEAAYSLAQVGASAEAVLPALLAAAGDPCVEVRRYVAEAFGGLGILGAPAVPVLGDMLAGDSDDQVRFESALALAQVGPPAADVVDVLGAVLDDGNRYVRDNSIQALKRIGTAEAEAVLFDYLLMARWCPITNRDTLF